MRGMRGSRRFEQQRRKDTFSYSGDGLSPCPNQLCHLNGEMMHRIFLSCILRCTNYLHPRRWLFHANRFHARLNVGSRV